MRWLGIFVVLLVGGEKQLLASRDQRRSAILATVACFCATVDPVLAGQRAHSTYDSAGTRRSIAMEKPACRADSKCLRVAVRVVVRLSSIGAAFGYKKKLFSKLITLHITKFQKLIA